MGNLQRGCNRQRCPFFVRVGRGFSELSNGQLEHRSLQRGLGVISVAEGVIEFCRADCGLNISIQQLEVGVAKPRIQGTVGIGVVAVTEIAHIIAVLAHH